MFLLGVAFGAMALIVIGLMGRLVWAWANPPLPRHWLPHEASAGRRARNRRSSDPVPLSARR